MSAYLVKLIDFCCLFEVWINPQRWIYFVYYIIEEGGLHGYMYTPIIINIQFTTGVYIRIGGFVFTWKSFSYETIQAEFNGILLRRQMTEGDIKLTLGESLSMNRLLQSTCMWVEDVSCNSNQAMCSSVAACSERSI